MDLLPIQVYPHCKTFKLLWPKNWWPPGSVPVSPTTGGPPSSPFTDNSSERGTASTGISTIASTSPVSGENRVEPSPAAPKLKVANVTGSSDSNQANNQSVITPNPHGLSPTTEDVMEDQADGGAGEQERSGGMSVRLRQIVVGNEWICP